MAKSHWVSGAASVSSKLTSGGGNVRELGTAVFTTYLFAFEATAALLVIAVVGAVVLARRPPMPHDAPSDQSPPELPS